MDIFSQDAPGGAGAAGMSGPDTNGLPDDVEPGREDHKTALREQAFRHRMKHHEGKLRKLDLSISSLRAVVDNAETSESLAHADAVARSMAGYRILVERLGEQVQAATLRLRTYGEAPPETVDLPTVPVDGDADASWAAEYPMDGCEPIGDAAFADLPSVLAESCAFWSRRHKRDVFLTSALGLLSGCLPKVEGYWGADVPAKVRPNLFTTFVAGASGGKSAGNFAKKLVRGVADRIRGSAQQDLAKWKKAQREAKQSGDTFDDPKPPTRTLYVEADISATHLLDRLSQQGGRGVIYSSEIDTLADALGQDWGSFDSFLRKAYHHEADGKGRRTDGSISVDDPCVSLVLGGTERQFAELIEDPENGLYSRLCLYYFEAFDSWQDQKPTPEGIRRLERFDGLSGRVVDLWSTLKGRNEPLRFEILDAHWRQIREMFAPLHDAVQQQGYSSLISVARRAGLWAFRIAMILTVLRAHDDGAPLRRLDTVEATDADVTAALEVARTYADHAIRFARGKLGQSEPASPRDRRIAAMLGAVGDTFTSGTAYDAARAADIDVHRSTLYRDLKAAERRGLIEAGNIESRWRKI